MYSCAVFSKDTRYNVDIPDQETNIAGMWFRISILQLLQQDFKKSDAHQMTNEVGKTLFWFQKKL